MYVVILRDITQMNNQKIGLFCVWIDFPQLLRNHTSLFAVECSTTTAVFEEVRSVTQIEQDLHFVHTTIPTHNPTEICWILSRVCQLMPHKEQMYVYWHGCKQIDPVFGSCQFILTCLCLKDGAKKLPLLKSSSITIYCFTNFTLSNWY